MDDLERLRARLSAGPAPARGSASGGSPAFLGKVLSTGSNLGVGKFFLARPVMALGAETDGTAGTLTDGTGSVAVYALGPTAPATGDYVVCRFVNYRWVAEKASGGASTVIIGSGTCTSCPVPTTLHMVSSNHAANYGTLQDATLVYGPYDPCYADLGFTGSGFVSTATFTDPNVTSTSGFRYHLRCLGAANQFILTRIWCQSNVSSPFSSGTEYSWVVGGFGNSCSPFFLHNGSAYPGSDPVVITIDP